MLLLCPQLGSDLSRIAQRSRFPSGREGADMFSRLIDTVAEVGIRRLMGRRMRGIAYSIQYDYCC